MENHLHFTIITGGKVLNEGTEELPNLKFYNAVDIEVLALTEEEALRRAKEIAGNNRKDFYVRAIRECHAGQVIEAQREIVNRVIAGEKNE